MAVLDPKLLPYNFHVVRDNYDDSVAETVPDKQARLMAHPSFAEWSEYWLGTRPFEWEGLHRNWRDLPSEMLLDTFTLEECARIWLQGIISSRLSDCFDNLHPLLWKLTNTHWQWGMSRSWNLLVRHLDGIKALDFGVPDFSVRLVYLDRFAQAGFAADLPCTFLDAPFALLVDYKGEHALTVGFVPCSEGILIKQVQLRQHKGNRFLYKLPKPYVEHVLDVFHRAFPADCIHLVTGDSAVQAVVESYGSKVPAIDGTRIAAVYDQKLKDYVRGAPVALHANARGSLEYTPVFHCAA